MTRNQLIALLILLLLAILAALGCVLYRAQVARVLGAVAPGRMNAEMIRYPNDLTLRYEWHAGTMPPPYHHEYIIMVEPGRQGEIVFYPDYAAEGVPEWCEAFAVTAKELDHLYVVMVNAQVFGGRWVPMSDPPIGGDIEWLDVTANGDTVRIPAQPEGGEALQPVYDAIRGLVPDETWARLRARRQEYIDNYER
jgi:hypothetical protein